MPDVADHQPQALRNLSELRGMEFAASVGVTGPATATPPHWATQSPLLGQDVPQWL